MCNEQVQEEWEPVDLKNQYEVLVEKFRLRVTVCIACGCRAADFPDYVFTWIGVMFSLCESCHRSTHTRVSLTLTNPQRTDMQSLKGREWLTDTIIDFYVHMIAERGGFYYNCDRCGAPNIG